MQKSFLHWFFFFSSFLFVIIMIVFVNRKARTEKKRTTQERGFKRPCMLLRFKKKKSTVGVPRPNPWPQAVNEFVHQVDGKDRGTHQHQSELLIPFQPGPYHHSLYFPVSIRSLCGTKGPLWWRW